MSLYEKNANRSYGLRWSEVYGKTTCWTLELSSFPSCQPNHRLCSNKCVWQQLKAWHWALQNHIDLGHVTQSLGFSKKGVCNWQKRMQLFTTFFLRAKNRMFSICGRGRNSVQPEGFLLTGWARWGDKLSEVGNWVLLDNFTPQSLLTLQQRYIPIGNNPLKWISSQPSLSFLSVKLKGGRHLWLVGLDWTGWFARPLASPRFKDSVLMFLLQPPKTKKVFSGILTLDIGALDFDLELTILGTAFSFASIKTFKRIVWAPNFWNIIGERPLGSPPKALLAGQFWENSSTTAETPPLHKGLLWLLCFQSIWSHLPTISGPLD